MDGTPYSPSVEDPYLETSTLAQVVQDALKHYSLALRVCIPCSVVKIHGNQLVDLQPLLQVRYWSQPGATTLKPIGSCPVSMPMGADWSVKYPLAVGDTGIAIICDRSLTAWMQGDGGVTDPNNPRSHDLSDAIFIPGLVPSNKQTQDATQDLVIRNGSAMVRLEKNGTFRIANNGQELVDLVGQMNQAMTSIVNTLQQAMTITMLGPQPLWQATQLQLTQAANTLSVLQNNLQTLKGQ